MVSKKSLFLKLFIAVFFCVAVGALSGIATASSVTTWYTTLNKPFFNPPSWLFAPVWTTLYAMMGVAAGLVWAKSAVTNVKLPMAIFVGQLALNSLWSVLFFGLRNPSLALAEIVLMWIMIALTIRHFYPISRPAAWLLVPYLAWVSFASILNAAIVILN